MNEFTIFFDDGGVLNNNLTRSKYWQQLIGEFFIPKFGGTTEAWKKANTKALDFEIKAIQNIYSNDPFYDYNQFWNEMSIDWINIMFKDVGIPLQNSQDAVSLAEEATKWITPQVHADYKGMSDVVKSLSKDYILNTASGESSLELHGYLSGMGIRDNFRLLFGPDLVNCFKASSEYYRLILKKANVKHEKAIIIDDSLTHLDYISQIGAIPILSSFTGNTSKIYPSFTKPDKLLSIISNITK